MQARQRFGVLAAALWWGSLTALGAIVVPLLFTSVPTPAQAGQMAAKLFAAQTWLSLGCGLVLLMLQRERDGTAGLGWAGGALGFLLAGLLAALMQEFAVAPRIVARENLKLWHSLGSGLFALQWLCAVVVLWKLAGRSADRTPDPGISPAGTS